MSDEATPATTTTSTPIEGTLLTTTATVKPGAQTSEFYITLFKGLLGVAATAGLFGGDTVLKIGGLALVAIIGAAYIISRGLAKGGSALVLCLILAVGGSQLTACSAAQKAELKAVGQAGYDCAKADVGKIVQSNGLTALGAVIGLLEEHDTTEAKSLLDQLKVQAGGGLIECAVKVATMLRPAKTSTSGPATSTAAAAQRSRATVADRAAEIIATEGWTYAGAAQ